MHSMPASRIADWRPACCSADILADYGIPWVILGHSERRSLLNESSQVCSPSLHLLHHLWLQRAETLLLHAAHRRQDGVRAVQGRVGHPVRGGDAGRAGG